MKTKQIIILVVALVLIGVGIFLVVQALTKQNDGGTVCTQEVKQCPDGSYVSRNSDNNCEFDACPSTGSAGGTFPEGTETQTHNIEIRDYAFSPKDLTIQVGDTIVWTNFDTAQHTVTSDSGTELDSEYLSKTETYSHTFTTVGNFAYHCKPHPYMKGTISVE